MARIVWVEIRDMIFRVSSRIFCLWGGVCGEYGKDTPTLIFDICDPFCENRPYCPE